MTDQDIKELRGYCEELEKYLAVSEDGQGKCLHDIRNTFDYVVNEAEKGEYASKAFTGNVASQAREASAILGGLWNCFNNLKISVTNFCDNQERANNGNNQ